MPNLDARRRCGRAVIRLSSFMSRRAIHAASART
jgi:hypothetical protein